MGFGLWHQSSGFKYPLLWSQNSSYPPQELLQGLNGPICVRPLSLTGSFSTTSLSHLHTVPSPGESSSLQTWPFYRQETVHLFQISTEEIILCQNTPEQRGKRKKFFKLKASYGCPSWSVLPFFRSSKIIAWKINCKHKNILATVAQSFDSF